VAVFKQRAIGRTVVRQRDNEKKQKQKQKKKDDE